MNRGNSRDWMWSEALQMLAQAERLQRQVFRPQGAALRVPTWEPPVDVLAREVVAPGTPGLAAVVAPRRARNMELHRSTPRRRTATPARRRRAAKSCGQAA